MNRDVYWRQECASVKIGRAPQSISISASRNGFHGRHATNGNGNGTGDEGPLSDMFVLSCPVMSRDHARFMMEPNRVRPLTILTIPYQ